MNQINLDDFKPKPHRLKPFFQRKRIPQIVIAKFLEVSQSRIAQWLNGYCEMPGHMEQRLTELAGQLELGHSSSKD